MKKFVNRVMIAVAVCALTGVMAFAEGKSGRVTFKSDVNVSGTLVKKGTYKVKFDDKTGEIAIMKNDETIVKTAGRLEQIDNKVRDTEIRYTGSGDTKALSRIIFAGDNQALVFGDAQMGK